MTDATTAPSSSAASPTGTSLLNDPTRVVVARKGGIYHLNKSPLEVIMQLPLPGVVIFVHGVNSDGEWYSETEEGLCDGLNDRLRRRDENLKFGGVAAGQLTPTRFMPELTADGFINPDMEADTFIQNDDTFSPVIRFRWGYKASGEELQKYGAGIYLNEENYWGGGPFANGCTTLPDLWGEGLSDSLFLWLHVQHMNPTERLVYTCPPRPYFVLAALRLARLVESLRKKQADVPITIVCHSQGNMIGMAAAFLGDQLPDATNPKIVGHYVADNYVLCNAPYSLVDKNGTENWSEGGMTDSEGRTGRQTGTARAQTLAAFFDIVGNQRAREQEAKRIDDRMANVAHGFTAQKDRERHGYNGSTYGRVTLYCNPQDQVISSTTVQGIGWRGMSETEIAATKGNGVFTQRVFAQGYEVGKRGTYHYWNDHHGKPKPGSPDFWYPRSPMADYSLTKGLDGNTTVVGQILTILTWPIFKLATRLVPTRINALPDDDWSIPLEAPDLPNTFTPKAKRFGPDSDAFDESCDAPGESRDENRARGAGDLYAGDHRLGAACGGKDAAAERTDAAAGNKESEAALRYDDHARLRMQARREGLYKNDAKVTEEDKPETASAGYTAWRNEKIKMNLAAGVDYHATDHSTIMTNAMHARKALAYDVAIGNCDISEKDLHKLRVAADWRFLKGLADGDPNKVFFEYFDSGKFKGEFPHLWTRGNKSEGAKPEKIIDRRQNPKFQPEGEA
jgi:pimeloyl-ACP methyl ester carboxylesterase